VAKLTSETLIGSLIAALTDPSALPQEQTPDKSNEVIIPPHLQDLQEQDLPEEQRGLVLSEISLFRERSARRDKPPQVVARQPQRQESGGGTRTWGQPQQEKEKGESHGLASKPIGFVQSTRDKEKQEPLSKTPGEPEKTDEEREKERLEARRRDEDNSFRDVSHICAVEDLVLSGLCISANVDTNLAKGNESLRSIALCNATGD
jgi:hypothetical protein